MAVGLMTASEEHGANMGQRKNILGSTAENGSRRATCPRSVPDDNKWRWSTGAIEDRLGFSDLSGEKSFAQAFPAISDLLQHRPLVKRDRLPNGADKAWLVWEREVR